ncbi:MAG TPA: MFS transporter [Actinophytocola sp.]|jgi:EmrB/QacA subfamily drug resistance transporter|uniref:MFS transporter n=1 Tax=Actinophytocola sp. TaxID=1872138 RepID=UPI002F91D55A
MTSTDSRSGHGGTAAQTAIPVSKRWFALAVLALAQLMIGLDATIMNIALPSAQADLHAADADRAWVITAYTLALAGLLMVGGRIADYLGRKRAFLIGLAGFCVASAVGGAAASFGMLVAGRALQGAFAAVLTPAVLSLLTVTFTEPKERAKAFAVYGAIASGGGAVGLLLGGFLTEHASWRWTLYVNVLIGLAVGIAGALIFVGTESGSRARFDIPGVLLVSGGLVAVVYACSEAVTATWSSTEVITLLITSAVLLAGFVLWESRAAQPLLPLRVLKDRNRVGPCIASGLAVVGMFGMFLLLTYYFQVVLGYSPVMAGLAFLPMVIGIAVSAFFIASPLLPKVPPRFLIAPGLVVAAVGLWLLTFLTVDSGFVAYTLPAEVLIGLGLGVVITPGFSVATQNVDRRDAGVVSALVSTAQQIGGSVGTALLNTIAASATVAYLATHDPADEKPALVHGYTTATAWAAGILLVAAVLAAILINAPKPAPRPQG